MNGLTDCTQSLDWELVFRINFLAEQLTWLLKSRDEYIKNPNWKSLFPPTQVMIFNKPLIKTEIKYPFYRFGLVSFV